MKNAAGSGESAITLKQIAELAGVSKMTVSLILNGSSQRRVSEETCAKVRNIAARFRYRPNRLAQVLSGGSTKIIGVLLDSLAGNLSMSALEHIERIAALRGYRVMVAVAHENIEKLHDNLCTFIQYQVDGIISMAHTYPGFEAEIRSCFCEPANVVFIAKPPTEHTSYVELDEGAGIRTALDHLMVTGRKRIGLLSERSDYANSLVRLKVFRQYAPNPELIRLLEPLPAGETLVPNELEAVIRDFILPHRLDGLITAADVWGMGVIQSLTRYDIHVPEDLAVVGWGNNLLCNYCVPSLSSVNPVTVEVVEAAVEMLFRLIQKMPVEPRTITPRLNIRQSSAVAPDMNRNAAAERSAVM